MAKVSIDGVEFDSDWIDGQIAKFKDPNVVWALRREELRGEIDIYEGLLKDATVPHDVRAKAHTKAYIAALRKTEQELMDEVFDRRMKVRRSV
jgi:hypothetical protein